MSDDIRVGEFTDEAEKLAVLESSLQQLQQTENVLMVVTIFAVLWFVIYLWSMWRCVNCLKLHYNSVWNSLNKPTVLKGNFALLKYVFGNQSKPIAKKHKWQFLLLRWLTMTGIVFAAILVVVAVMLL